MSTSLLSHAFGIRGDQHRRTGYRDGQAAFMTHQEPRACRCPARGSRAVRPRGTVGRRFRAVPIGCRPTAVVLPIPRVECRACGVARQAEAPFADPRRSDTESFERYAPEPSRRLTIRDVAMHPGVGGDVVEDIQGRDPSRRLARPKLEGLRRIAIGEIAAARGHRYPAVVMDLGSGAVAFVGDGKGADASKPSRKRLRRGEARIEAVARGRSAAYRGAVLAHLPGATAAFDRFHLVGLFNDKPSELRGARHREATEAMHQQVLEGARRLLLKGPEDLDEAKGQRRRLEEAPAPNRPLAAASYLKGDLRRSWGRPDKRPATALLADWIKRAATSGIKALRQRARTLAAHRGGPLAYDDVPITSGPMEGTTNEIKTMRRQADGFRDQELFELKTPAIPETRYALVG